MTKKPQDKARESNWVGSAAPGNPLMKHSKEMFDAVKLARYSIKGIKDNRKSGGVICNGFDNLFPDYLNGLYNNSVTHNSVVNDLVGYVLGKGLVTASPEEQAKLDKFFPKQKLQSILRFKEVQEAITLEVLKNPFKEITEINIFNPAQIRVSEVTDGIPTGLKYRKSWDREDTTNYKYTQDFRNIMEDDECYEGVFYWYDSGTFPVYYGRPSYMGGLNAIELEISIYMMHNHGAQNGMFPSMVIAKPSSGDPDQDKLDAKETQKQMTGVANAGKIIQTYFPSGGQAPVFSTPNLTGLDKIYENQYAVAEAGILKAHSVPSPLLIAGLNQKSSGLGSLDDELQWAKEEMFEKLVKPKRLEFIEAMSPLFKMIGIQGKVEFIDITDQDEEAQSQDAASRFNEFGVGGVQGILSIQTSIAEGTTSLEAGIATLKFIYGFDESAAREMLGGGKTIISPSGEPVVQVNEDLEEENKVNDNLKNLTGRQMQNVERIVRKFRKSQITYQQAEMMLTQGFGMSREEAKIWLESNDNEELTAKLNKNINCECHLSLNDNNDYVNLINNNIDKIIDLGEDADDLLRQGFVLVDSREVDYELEDELNRDIKEQMSNIKLVSTGTARPSQESAYDGEKDDEQYKVRYRYAGDTTIKSREFCRRMTEANKLYRKEDIDQMSFSGVNPGFGIRGSRNYSIFQWKGGIYCHHYWERVTFIKEGLKGSIDFKSPRAKTLTESQADARGMKPTDEPSMVGRKPIDTPSRGRYTFSKLRKIINSWL